MNFQLLAQSLWEVQKYAEVVNYGTRTKIWKKVNKSMIYIWQRKTVITFLTSPYFETNTEKLC